MFPIDFSEPCARAAEAVAAISERFDAGLTLLHAASFPQIPEMPYPGRVYSALRKELLEASTSAMDRFVARQFPSQVLDRVIEEGDPAHAIVDYAHKRKIDLIMMPTHGYGPFRQFLTGSVTAKVLHDARCPVWTSAHSERTSPRAAAEYRNILCAVDSK